MLAAARLLVRVSEGEFSGASFYHDAHGDGDGEFWLKSRRAADGQGPMGAISVRNTRGRPQGMPEPRGSQAIAGQL